MKYKQSWPPLLNLGVLPGHLDTPRAVMIKMVLPTGDLLLPGRWVPVPYPDCQVMVDVGCLATSPQFTGSLRASR